MPTLVCTYPRLKGKQRCIWHYAIAQPAHIQKELAGQRYADAIAAHGGPEKFQRLERVAPAAWPADERWCSGCQSFVPLFYCTGSRCKACASSAAHAQRVEKVYGITGEEYDALLRAQGGVCFICQRPPGTKRLAVDHDHVTGAVRGLLCASNEFGCNRAILGNIKDIAMARRILLYLDVTPYQRLKGVRPRTWEEFCADEARLAREERYRLQNGTVNEVVPPPF